MISPRAFRGASASVIVLSALIGSAGYMAVSSAAYADSGAAGGVAGGATGASTSDTQGGEGGQSPATSTASEKAVSASGSESKGKHSAQAGNVSVSVGLREQKRTDSPYQ